MNRVLITQAIHTIGYYAAVCGEDDQDTPAKQTIKALKAELEKPEPEPYAWVFVPHNELLWPDEVEHKTPCKATGYVPLYTKGTI